AESKHPWHPMAAKAVRASRMDLVRQDENWLFHPYCLPILRRSLDDRTPTGAKLSLGNNDWVWRTSPRAADRLSTCPRSSRIQRCVRPRLWNENVTRPRSTSISWPPECLHIIPF